MPQSLIKQLQLLSQSDLVELVVAATEQDKQFASAVKLKVAERDPKLLAKQLKQQINGIKRSKRFLDYYHSIEMGQKLHGIITVLETKLLPLSPEHAASCCQLLQAISVPLIERSDDSAGAIGEECRRVSSIWGKSVSQKPDQSTNWEDLVFDLWLGDDYRFYHDVFIDFKAVLGTDGLQRLESRIADLPRHKDYGDYKKCSGLKLIADAQGDVDAYILCCEHSGLRSDDYLEIVERLNRKDRAVEALAWLDKMTSEDINRRYSRYVAARIDSYSLECDEDSAQKIRWEAFEKTLSPDYYIHYCKYLSVKAKAIAKEAALTLAQKASSFEMAIHFLDEIGEHGLLAEHVLANQNELPNVYYGTFRPLSKRLAANGYSLAAVLIRRGLVQGVLNKAKSKYYKYSASDLKLAHDYGQSIDAWRGCLSHELFMQQLKATHAKKHAFWSWVEGA